MYEAQTYEAILSRMLQKALSINGNLDTREGSLVWYGDAPAAVELQNLYIALDTVLNETFADTATRPYLILRAAERGLKPQPASPAVLQLSITPTTLHLPMNTRFSIGELNYYVSADRGSGKYEITCETAGEAGNDYTGTVIPIEYVDGLETCSISAVVIPGEDEEDTEVLRKRYFDSFEEKAFGGNVRDYLEKTNAIPGVGSTKVTRIWNADIRPAEMIPTAAVEAWYTSIIDTLDAEVAVWLAAVYTAAVEKKLTTGGTVLLTILNSDFGAASKTLIDKVQEVIDPAENAGEGYGLAPIGHVVSIKSARNIEVKISTAITFDTGYSWSNLQTSIDAAIEEYLLELRKAWADSDHLTVRISQIETRLLTIKGIVDIDNTKINGAADNLILGKYEVPIYGGATA